MTKWEYAFLPMDLAPVDNVLEVNEEALNDMGDDGWEAFAITPKTGAGEAFHLALLKRPKSK
ncbi:DUF4177 domain-containing protein [Nitrospinae bacterium AH_259_B05_G02_I21]|nr:DUF4177 domain-containing protein [Nitrospinae bacterium AH_259_B05_G02_I21]MDA2932607.1 DUF4177 domain-containing protein [Nitrospinae bacterium AH-259-F20]